jgi:uncharacterized membrane protein
MGVWAYALLLAGVFALTGTAAGRSRFLAVPVALWVALELLLAATGNLQSDQDTPTELAILSFVLILLPATAGAVVATAAGKLIRHPR